MIKGFHKTSLIDYPNKVSSIVFYEGCNFNCDYCHNKELLSNNSEEISSSHVLNHLTKRSGLVDGVVLSGGEVSLHSNSLNLARAVKNQGKVVKFDTNGSNPTFINKIIEEELVDFIAMDIKGSYDKYNEIIGLVDFDSQLISESVNLIKESKVDYEFRTTLIKEYHDINDICKIGEIVRGSKRVALQQFQNIEGNLKNYETYSKKEIENFAEILMNDYEVDEVVIRARF